MPAPNVRLADPVVQHLSPVDNIRVAYHALEADVRRALLTQVGDAARLGDTRSRALALLQSAEQHQAAFPVEEYAIVQRSIASIVQHLDDACHVSSDPPPQQHLVVATRTSTGRRGRPKIQISAQFLEQALQLRGPTHIAPAVGCSARTVRRRALEAGLVHPGPPVLQTVRHADGTVTRTTTSTSRAFTDLTDEELDRRVSSALEDFPRIGRSMLRGVLTSSGIHVPVRRIAQSFLRVHGTPGVFGGRAIHRKVYSVAGANSLWHHDGQHGLIRFKIVIHCFIDGKSRFITGIGAHNNNRAETVLLVFIRAKDKHGVPSRVRGDHGTENLRVAEWMEENRGQNRGSYIWGRSVHNTRIERLWYDVTHTFGQKWKNFFIDLEANCGLNPRLPAHIWLLHYLFLSSVNEDALKFADTWNNHVMQIRGSRNQSPREMYLFSLLQDGPRGLDHILPQEEDIEDLTTYGIDWEVTEDERLMNHLLANNPDEVPIENPFRVGPTQLSHVPCEAPDCPLTPQQLAHLEHHLPLRANLDSHSMEVRRVVWTEAMDICSEFFTV